MVAIRKLRELASMLNDFMSQTGQKPWQYFRLILCHKQANNHDNIFD